VGRGKVENAMKPKPYEPVSMRLHGCDVGWIYMVLSTPTSKVNIRLSTCFDPIPNFICWMEALQTDVMHCGFGIEEEGPEKYFFARTHWNGRYQLTISEGDFEGAEEYLKVVVHRRQMIETIYRGFQDFGASPDYIPRMWGIQTLGECIAEQTGATLKGVVDFLEQLDDDSLYRFFHAVLPTMYCGIPEEVKCLPGLPEMLAFALLPGNPLVAESINHYAKGWKMTLPVERRREDIVECLNAQASPYDGTPLDTLRSEVLEQYLASDRDPL